MKIIRKDGLYLARCKYSEKDIPRDAGFEFNVKLKRWATNCDDIANKLYKYTVGNARERLDTIVAVKEAALASSYAEDHDEDFPSPEGLSYLAFQKGGIAYGMAHKDTLIADQPGLGKTIQLAGLSNTMPRVKRTLIICPASLKINWQRELLKWTVHGYTVGIAETRVRQKKQPDGHVKKWMQPIWPDTDIIIVNYDLLPHFHDEIREKPWDLLCCDESHMLKNGKAIRTKHVLGGGRGKKNVTAIEAGKRVFLTGTPITNKPIDLWTTVTAFDPEGWGKNFKKFAFRFCDAIKTHFGFDTSGASNLTELREYLRTTFMIRRLKSDVLKDLPAKRRQIFELPAAGMRKVVKKELEVFEDNLARMVAFNEGEDYDPKEALADMTPDQIVDLMSNIFSKHKLTGDFREDADKLDEAFAYHFEAMSLVREETAMAKIPMAKEYIDRILESGEKVIVFVVHKTVATELRNYYENCGFVTGSVSKKKRQAEVDRFQEDPECRVMISNIAAGGVGYTMTAATHVIFVEFSWTPIETEQAEDRAHRIGQENAVHAHYLVVQGSLEAQMIETIIDKLDIINEALDGKNLTSED